MPVLHKALVVILHNHCDTIIFKECKKIWSVLCSWMADESISWWVTIQDNLGPMLTLCVWHLSEAPWKDCLSQWSQMSTHWGWHKTHWGWDKMDTWQFCRRSIQTYFLEWDWCVLFQISLQFVLKDPIKNIPAFGQKNGLALIRRQAIVWTNDGLVYWRIYVSLGLNEWMICKLSKIWGTLCVSCENFPVSAKSFLVSIKVFTSLYEGVSGKVFVIVKTP